MQPIPIQLFDLTLIQLANWRWSWRSVQLTISPLVIVVIPLISMTLCGLGALVGLIARTPEETGSLSTLVTFL